MTLLTSKTNYDHTLQDSTDVFLNQSSLPRTWEQHSPYDSTHLVSYEQPLTDLKGFIESAIPNPLRTELASLQNALETCQKEKTALGAKVQTETFERVRLMSLLDITREELRTTQRQLLQLRYDPFSTLAVNAALQRKIGDMRLHIDSLTNESTKLKSTIQKLSSAQGDAINESVRKSLHIETVEAERSRLAESLLSAQYESTEFTRKIAMLETENSAQRRHITALERLHPDNAARRAFSGQDNHSTQDKPLPVCDVCGFSNQEATAEQLDANLHVAELSHQVESLKQASQQLTSHQASVLKQLTAERDRCSKAVDEITKLTTKCNLLEINEANSLKKMEAYMSLNTEHHNRITAQYSFLRDLTYTRLQESADSRAHIHGQIEEFFGFFGDIIGIIWMLETLLNEEQQARNRIEKVKQEFATECASLFKELQTRARRHELKWTHIQTHAYELKSELVKIDSAALPDSVQNTLASIYTSLDEMVKVSSYEIVETSATAKLSAESRTLFVESRLAEAEVFISSVFSDRDRQHKWSCDLNQKLPLLEARMEKLHDSLEKYIKLQTNKKHQSLPITKDTNCEPVPSMEVEASDEIPSTSLKTKKLIPSLESQPTRSIYGRFWPTFGLGSSLSSTTFDAQSISTRQHQRRLSIKSVFEQVSNTISYDHPSDNNIDTSSNLNSAANMVLRTLFKKEEMINQLQHKIADLEVDVKKCKDPTNQLYTHSETNQQIVDVSLLKSTISEEQLPVNTNEHMSSFQNSDTLQNEIQDKTPIDFSSNVLVPVEPAYQDVQNGTDTFNTRNPTVSNQVDLDTTPDRLTDQDTLQVQPEPILLKDATTQSSVKITRSIEVQTFSDLIIITKDKWSSVEKELLESNQREIELQKSLDEMVLNHDTVESKLVCADEKNTALESQLQDQTSQLTIYKSKLNESDAKVTDLALAMAAFADQPISTHMPTEFASTQTRTPFLLDYAAQTDSPAMHSVSVETTLKHHHDNSSQTIDMMLIPKDRWASIEQELTQTNQHKLDLQQTVEELTSKYDQMLIEKAREFERYVAIESQSHAQNIMDNHETQFEKSVVDSVHHSSTASTFKHRPISQLFTTNTTYTQTFSTKHIDGSNQTDSSLQRDGSNQTDILPQRDGSNQTDILLQCDGSNQTDTSLMVVSKSEWTHIEHELAECKQCKLDLQNTVDTLTTNQNQLNAQYLQESEKHNLLKSDSQICDQELQHHKLQVEKNIKEINLLKSTITKLEQEIALKSVSTLTVKVQTEPSISSQPDSSNLQNGISQTDIIVQADHNAQTDDSLIFISKEKWQRFDQELAESNQKSLHLQQVIDELNLAHDDLKSKLLYETEKRDAFESHSRVDDCDALGHSAQLEKYTLEIARLGSVIACMNDQYVSQQPQLVSVNTETDHIFTLDTTTQTDSKTVCDSITQANDDRSDFISKEKWNNTVQDLEKSVKREQDLQQTIFDLQLKYELAKSDQRTAFESQLQAHNTESREYASQITTSDLLVNDMKQQIELHKHQLKDLKDQIIKLKTDLKKTVLLEKAKELKYQQSETQHREYLCTISTILSPLNQDGKLDVTNKTALLELVSNLLPIISGADKQLKSSFSQTLDFTNSTHELHKNQARLREELQNALSEMKLLVVNNTHLKDTLWQLKMQVNAIQSHNSARVVSLIPAGLRNESVKDEIMAIQNKVELAISMRDKENLRLEQKLCKQREEHLSGLSKVSNQLQAATEYSRALLINLEFSNRHLTDTKERLSAENDALCKEISRLHCMQIENSRISPVTPSTMSHASIPSNGSQASTKISTDVDKSKLNHASQRFKQMVIRDKHGLSTWLSTVYTGSSTSLSHGKLATMAHQIMEYCEVLAGLVDVVTTLLTRQTIDKDTVSWLSSLPVFDIMLQKLDNPTDGFKSDGKQKSRLPNAIIAHLLFDITRDARLREQHHHLATQSNTLDCGTQTNLELVQPERSPADAIEQQSYQHIKSIPVFDETEKQKMLDCCNDLLIQQNHLRGVVKYIMKKNVQCQSEIQKKNIQISLLQTKPPTATRSVNCDLNDFIDRVQDSIPNLESIKTAYVQAAVVMTDAATSLPLPSQTLASTQTDTIEASVSTSHMEKSVSVARFLKIQRKCSDQSALILKLQSDISKLASIHELPVKDTIVDGSEALIKRSEYEDMLQKLVDLQVDLAMVMGERDSVKHELAQLELCVLEEKKSKQIPLGTDETVDSITESKSMLDSTKQQQTHFDKLVSDCAQSDSRWKAAELQSQHYQNQLQAANMSIEALTTQVQKMHAQSNLLSSPLLQPINPRKSILIDAETQTSKGISEVYKKQKIAASLIQTKTNLDLSKRQVTVLEAENTSLKQAYEHMRQELQVLQKPNFAERIKQETHDRDVKIAGLSDQLEKANRQVVQLQSKLLKIEQVMKNGVDSLRSDVQVSQRDIVENIQNMQTMLADSQSEIQQYIQNVGQELHQGVTNRKKLQSSFYRLKQSCHLQPKQVNCESQTEIVKQFENAICDRNCNCNIHSKEMIDISHTHLNRVHAGLTEFHATLHACIVPLQQHALKPRVFVEFVEHILDLVHELVLLCKHDDTKYQNSVLNANQWLMSRLQDKTVYSSQTASLPTSSVKAVQLDLLPMKDAQTNTFFTYPTNSPTLSSAAPHLDQESVKSDHLTQQSIQNASYIDFEKFGNSQSESFLADTEKDQRLEQRAQEFESELAHMKLMSKKAFAQTAQTLSNLYRLNGTDSYNVQSNSSSAMTIIKDKAAFEFSSLEANINRLLLGDSTVEIEPNKDGHDYLSKDMEHIRMLTKHSLQTTAEAIKMAAQPPFTHSWIYQSESSSATDLKSRPFLAKKTSSLTGLGSEKDKCESDHMNLKSNLSIITDGFEKSRPRQQSILSKIDLSAKSDMMESLSHDLAYMRDLTRRSIISTAETIRSAAQCDEKCPDLDVVTMDYDYPQMEMQSGMNDTNKAMDGGSTLFDIETMKSLTMASIEQTQILIHQIERDRMNE
ncbi:hypothetical protein BDV3_003397 [Batrachochytrium dendrobatidis]